MVFDDDESGVPFDPEHPDLNRVTETDGTAEPMVTDIGDGVYSAQDEFDIRKACLEAAWSWLTKRCTPLYNREQLRAVDALDRYCALHRMIAVYDRIGMTIDEIRQATRFNGETIRKVLAKYRYFNLF